MPNFNLILKSFGQISLFSSIIISHLFSPEWPNEGRREGGTMIREKEREREREREREDGGGCWEREG